MNKHRIQTSRQKKLATEKRQLKTLLEDHPTPKQRVSAKQRIEDIEVESKVDGWLASKNLQPPK